MINISPDLDRTIVVYRGKVATTVEASFLGDYALIIDGQRVPDEEIDEWYRETMRFDWRGQPFGLDRYCNGRVLGVFLGVNSRWARDNGLEGSQYDGYRLDVPEREIDNVRIVRSDSLEWRRYLRTFKVSPPDDLFDYVRPATDQEWIKE